MHVGRNCVFPFLVAWAGVGHAAVPSVLLEDLAWTELRNAERAGETTFIIPVVGTGYCAKRFSSASQARQSMPVRQYSASACR
jgi:hypothetical protein